MNNLDSLLEKIKEVITQKLSKDVIEPIIDKVDDVVVNKLTSSDFIEVVVGKAIDAAKNKLQNYIYIAGGLYALIIVLLLLIIYLLYKRK